MGIWCASACEQEYLQCKSSTDGSQAFHSTKDPLSKTGMRVSACTISFRVSFTTTSPLLPLTNLAMPQSQMSTCVHSYLRLQTDSHGHARNLMHTCASTSKSVHARLGSLSYPINCPHNTQDVRMKRLLALFDAPHTLLSYSTNLLAQAIFHASCTMQRQVMPPH